MKTLKKSLALLLTLVMCLGLCAVPAFAEDKTVNNATELKNALEVGGNITIGSAITLSEDVTLGGDVTLSGSKNVTIGANITINGNGHTFSIHKVNTSTGKVVGIIAGIDNVTLTLTNMTIPGLVFQNTKGTVRLGGNVKYRLLTYDKSSKQTETGGSLPSNVEAAEGYFLPTEAGDDSYYQVTSGTESRTGADVTHGNTTTKYNTLSAAFAAVTYDITNGVETIDTVKLYENVTEPVTVGSRYFETAGRYFYVDLNGHSITGSLVPITDTMQFDVTDETVDGVSLKKYTSAVKALGADDTDTVAAIGTVGYPSLKLAMQAVQKDETIVIKKADFETLTTDGAAASAFTVDLNSQTVNGITFTGTRSITLTGSGTVNGTVNLNGGTLIVGSGADITFNSTFTLGSNGSEGVLIANAGTFEKDFNARYGSLTVPTGSTAVFSSSVNAEGGYTGSQTQSGTANTVTIAGGTFEGALTASGNSNDPGSQTNVGKFEITGGQFKVRPDDGFLADGYAFSEEPNSEGYYTVVEVGAKVTHNGIDKGYETLSAAINEAQSGDTVTMLHDYSGQISIPAGKSITLDLNGKTLKLTSYIPVNGNLTVEDGSSNGTGEITSSDYDFIVENNGSLTINSGSIVASDSEYGVYARGNSTFIMNGGSIKAGTPLGTNGSKQGDNYSNGVKATINGGSLTSDVDVAVYLPAGTLTINGGTLTGKTAVYAKGGWLNIPATSTAKIVGTGEKTAFKYSGGGCYPTGDALVLDNSNYPYGPVSAIISGGTFTSEKAQSVGTYAKEGLSTATGFITGGTFSSDPTAYLATGYKASGSGPYTVANYSIVKDNTQTETDTYTVDGTQNITVSSDDNTDDAVAPTVAAGNVKNVEAVIATALNEAGANAGNVSAIVLDMEVSNPSTEGTGDEMVITYDHIYPVAIAKNSSGGTVVTTKITNDQLSGSFTLTLQAPTGADYAQVNHYDSDGTTIKETKVAKVVGGKVTVAVDSFSKELSINNLCILK